MDDWKPIETAPKDGTRVLGFAGSGSKAIAIVSWWNATNFAAGVWVNDRDQLFGPTHWMPLPAPPKVEE
jgi:hypothetical protein